MKIPTLDFANPLHTFSSNNLSYIATKECYVLGRMKGSNYLLKINDVSVAGGTSGYNGAAVGANVPYIRMMAGDVATTTNAQDDLNVFALKT